MKFMSVASVKVMLVVIFSFEMVLRCELTSIIKGHIITVTKKINLLNITIILSLPQPPYGGLASLFKHSVASLECFVSSCANSVMGTPLGEQVQG